jgi:phospholipase/carboxylesterase
MNTLSRDNAAMNTPPNSTALLETIEHETGPDPQWTVLWLHGLGADGHDFAPIVPELVGRDWPAVRFVFPHAPVRAVTINNGMRMRAWYDIRDFSNLANRADREGVEESVAQVEALIAREGERGVPPERIVLAGFSQGGAVTLAAGLRRKQPLAGLVVLSAYLPTVPTGADVPAAARRQPAFVAHGSHDPVVPFAAGQQTVDVLRGFGIDVEWHAYPMAHQVCAEQIADLRGWFAKRFADRT